MNIHYACITTLLHIHSLEDTGDKCRIYRAQNETYKDGNGEKR